MCVYCTTWIHGALRNGTGVTDGCKQPCECWEGKLIFSTRAICVLNCGVISSAPYFYLCMSLCLLCDAGACRSQKRALGSLELE